MLSAIRKRQSNLTLILENVWDPHNVGAILRTCDAVGLSGVHLLYYIERAPDFRRAGKLSSASAKKWLDIIEHDSIEKCVASIRERGLKLFASHLIDASVSLYDIDLTQPAAIIVGNEHRGVSKELLAHADEVFTIPMMGMVESLNVSVATAVTLFEACRQRLTAGMYEESALSEDDIQNMLADWATR